MSTCIFVVQIVLYILWQIQYHFIKILWTMKNYISK